MKTIDGINRKKARSLDSSGNIFLRWRFLSNLPAIPPSLQLVSFSIISGHGATGCAPLEIPQIGEECDALVYEAVTIRIGNSDIRKVADTGLYSIQRK